MRKFSYTVTALIFMCGAHALLASADPEPAPPLAAVVSAPQPAPPPTDVPVVLAPVVPAKKPHRSWPSPALGRSTSGSPEVLFTFDDGPGGAFTTSVLDTLRAHGVQAIFFLIGRNVGDNGRAKHGALIDRMLAEGHAIGNHTETHRDLCLRSSAAKLDAEIDDSARQIAEVAKMNIVLFRAPYGVRCAQLEQALDARHMQHMHWDVDAQEWRTHDAARTQAVIIGALGRLRDDQRAVVLTHDIHAATVTALPVILEWIRNENVRRAAAGRKQIRVLSPSDIALEQLAPEMRSLLAAVELGAGLPELERRLIAPLTSPRAQAGVPSL